jgi:excisionase family DNA binding protein|tara:strand:+ start:1753 stop:2061 length:309 start_codon:yes stop_codon:yes gene_type:complete
MKETTEQILSKQIEDLKVKIENIEKLFLTQKNVLNFSELKLYTNLSESYLYELTSSGGIPCYKPNGKKLYFKKQEIEDWLLSNRKATNIELDELASSHISIA